MANEYAIPAFTVDAVLASSLADYSKTPVDQVYNSNVLLRVLNKRKRLIDGGVSIVYPLITTDQNAGGFYLGSGQLNTLQPDNEAFVEFRWQNLYEPIQLTRDEERQNSGSEHKIYSLVGEKIERSQLAIAKRAEQALSTPVAGANNLIDLETMVGTGTLGTINGATSTYWQSTVTTSGSFAAQGRSDISTASYAVSGSATEDFVDIYFTNKTNFQRYEQTLLPTERHESSNLTVNGGARNLTFKGVPVTYGNFIGSGLWFGLNTEYIDFCVDTETDFAMTEFVRPANQTVKVAYILLRCNNVTNNRRRHFKLQSITA